VLSCLPLEGRLVTGDALYCQREICRQIIDGGGHYLLIVKANQPTLYRDIELFFSEPPFGERFATAESRGRRGDREEMRRLSASSGLGGYLDWPGAQQVMKIERRTERRGKAEREVRYAITSQGCEVGPEELLSQVRRHWRVENRLHYVRDVSFGEDASQVRKGSAPQVMAALRNSVIGVLRAAGWSNIAAGLRHYAWQPAEALRLLGLTP
jgi:predicted transposase YbfD/YdcC